MTASGGTPWIAKKKKKSKAKVVEVEAQAESAEGEEDTAQAGPTTTSIACATNSSTLLLHVTAVVQRSLCTAAGKKLNPTAVSVQSGKTYEQEFAPEIERAQVRSSSFRTMLLSGVPGAANTSNCSVCRLANPRPHHGALATDQHHPCYMVIFSFQRQMC